MQVKMKVQQPMSEKNVLQADLLIWTTGQTQFSNWKINKCVLTW